MNVMSSLSDTRKWTGRVVTWVLLLHLVCLSQGGVVLDLQAEDTVGYDPANARWRSNASNARSVLLQRDGDFLRFVICLPSDMQVFVEDVRYSTDGWSKIGAILVDEQETGTFETADNSNFGNSWNLFHSSGSLTARFLSKGKHTIDVKLKMSMSSDPWGIEIDEIKIGLSSDLTRQEVTCEDPEKSSSGTSDYESNVSYTPNDFIGKLSLRKNGYYACSDGEYRLDLFPQSQVTGLTINISRPAQGGDGCKSTTAPIRVPRSERSRKVVLAVGNDNARYSCRQVSDLTDLTIDSFSSIDRLNATLPARVTPERLSSFSLRFSLPEETEAESVTFSMRVSCLGNSRKQLELDVTLQDVQNGNIIVKGPRIVDLEDESEGRFTLTIPASLREAMVSVHFPDVKTTFVMNSLAVDFLPAEVNRGKTNAAVSNDHWLAPGLKRQVLYADNGVRVEVVNVPGAKSMKIKMSGSQNGNRKEISGSRILLYSSQEDAGSLRMVFDQTSRCYFFPELEANRQVSFSLGQRDLEVESPDSDIEEVELSSTGRGRLTLTLTRTRYVQRRVHLTFFDQLTSLFLDDVRDVNVQRYISYQTSLSAIMLPCSDNRLTTDIVVKADETDGVSVNDPWRTVTGKVVRVTRS
ncbi:hypothetical protein C0Q70_00821 [Pomacea canaliculata]|uniref:Uncharacterized protein n=1 Tax=Pomacea canaliculata TaxID=400727 RepID=A0A2T7PXT8_POMCA|nr:hypothetical protein C0Q70_00821 [Pomacea canaliculata]